MYPPPRLPRPIKVVEKRLRSFDTAGARVRNMMLERLTGVLARLHTFELIEGGRESTLLASSATATASAGAAAAAASKPAAVVPPSGALIRPPGDDDDDSRAEDGDGEPAVAGIGGKENQGCWRDGAGDGGDDDHNGEGEDAHPVGGPGRRPASPRPVPSSRAGSEDGGSGGDDAGLSEVERWQQFRTADLVSFVGRALQAGDIQAAAVAWRRHGRTDRGAGRAAAAGGGRGVSDGKEGRRMGVALPGQLVAVPAGAPPLLLGGWLRDEVLPWLDVVGVVAVSVFSKQAAEGVQYLSYGLVESFDLLALPTRSAIGPK